MKDSIKIESYTCLASLGGYGLILWKKIDKKTYFLTLRVERDEDPIDYRPIILRHFFSEKIARKYTNYFIKRNNLTVLKQWTNNNKEDKQ